MHTQLLDRFEKLLSDKEIVFVRTLRLQPPLENLIFNAKIGKGW
ncbi:hypothetical protein [Marivirga arenosa]|nr:hypothetical protein [Marivirga sp. BKB1-2]